MNPTKPTRFHYRLGANQPAASPTARRLTEMAEAILNETGGAFRLEVFPESRLGPDPQMFAALDGALGDMIRAELGAAGLHAFPRAWQNGFHHITTSKRPIESADDFAGLKIRSPGGEFAADFFRTLGAEPGMVPFSGLYDALKAKTFDGQSDPLGVVQSLRLHEVQRYLSLTAHWWTGFTLLAHGAV